MKRLLIVLFSLFLLLNNANTKAIYADSIDVYLKTSLNGSENTVIANERTSIKIEAGSGDITNGVVGTGGATITISTKDGYVFDKVVFNDSESTPTSKDMTITLLEGDVINQIEVDVIDTVNAYNKPVTIDVTKFKYGLKLSDMEIVASDSDLVLQGKNLFYSYDLIPVEEITKPGIYGLLMIYDSTEFEHFPGNDNHFYINDVTIDGSYYIDKEVVHEYGIERATKGINVSDDSQNYYLYLLPYFYLPGLSVEYLENSDGDTVTNMPANEIQIYLANSPVLVNETVIPARDGYDFVGWSLTKDGEVITNTTMPSDGLKLYAIWKSQTSVPTVEIATITNEKTIEENDQEVENKTETIIEPYRLVNTGVY